MHRKPRPVHEANVLMKQHTAQARYVVHVIRTHMVWAAENLNGMEVLGRTSSLMVAQSSGNYGTRSGRHCGLGQLLAVEFESGMVGLE